MPTGSPFVRPAVVAGLIVAGGVGLVGGLALQGPGLVAVGIAGVLAACLGWGMAREVPGPHARSAAESAVVAAVWTVGILLVLSGASVLAGGVIAALLAGAGAVAGLAYWVVRTPKDDAPSPSDAAAPLPPASPAVGRPAPQRQDARGTARVLPPVTAMSTEALGNEWMDSSAALAGHLQPDDRQSIVRRRQETLDELERRDPAGFLRWLAAGPDGDPAGFVRGKAGEATG